jgi:hypothetical protein|tara:strand:+ start:267 stop:464 length:198 start_codon:yes stop_codon:yes gene_type:complete
MDDVGEGKLSDIFAILITEERTDLVDYLTGLIKKYIVDESSSSESDGEDEEFIVNIDEDGYYSLG